MEQLKTYAVTFGGGTLAFIGVLTLAFIVLRIWHIVSWAWVWILSPLWIPMGLASLFVLCILAFIAVISICVYLFARKEDLE